MYISSASASFFSYIATFCQTIYDCICFTEPSPSKIEELPKVPS